MEQAVSYLTKKYEQAETIFSVASPFGQLLNVIANISELIFTYISHTAEELNIHTAQNHESIFGLSRLTGHDPFRGSSAYGTIVIKANNSAPGIVNGNNIIIKNFTQFTINETGEKYFINLNDDYIKINVNDTVGAFVYIMQGEIESQTFISNGEPLQTFNPIVKNMTDNDNVSVTVNGEEWKKVDSLYDMPADDDGDDCKCFMVKSSINVGLTIIFGNESFGKIPPAGSQIIVTYIKTSGESGNVYNNNFKVSFIDTATDDFGNEIELNDVIDISVLQSPTLGSNYESPEFTKLIAPNTSRSFVLADDKNYEAFLSRYNQFSSIYPYRKRTDNFLDDDNITYLKVLPNIKRKLSSNMDYFSLPTNEFILSSYERKSLEMAIHNSGREIVGTEISIEPPTIQKFVINIVVRPFVDYNKSIIRTDIRSLLSTYFLNINRKDIIPLSDIISIVESINGVDTCDVFFLTEKNENAKKYGSYIKYEKDNISLKQNYVEKEITVNYGEDPKVDFDNFGNIVIGDDELYLPKGGWIDADGNEYTETPEDGKLGPLNIFFISNNNNDDDSKIYTMNMQKKLNNLLKNSY